MKFRKTLSLIMAVVLSFTTLVGASVAASADTTQEVVYTYKITTDKTIAAFDGDVSFPSNYTLQNNVVFYDGDTVTSGSETINPTTSVCDNINNTLEGNRIDEVNELHKYKFNFTYKKDLFDFSAGKALVTLTFTVNGAYDISDITTKMNDIYNIENVREKNVPYRYDEYLNGEAVRSGQDNTGNPDEHIYTLHYNYQNDSNVNTSLTYVKTLSDASLKTIAEGNMPQLKTASYKYSVDEANIISNGNYEYTINLTREAILYTVTLTDEDGNYEEVGSYEYLQQVTVNPDGQEHSFLIDGNIIAVGTSFTFYVGGNTDVELAEPEETADTYAVTNDAGYTLEQDKFSMQMLATAKAGSFKRMGVAYSNAPLSINDIKTTAAKDNLCVSERSVKDSATGVIVYTSKVNKANVSGQYQFLFAPYFTGIERFKDFTFYFYTFIVDNNNVVTVSDTPVTFSMPTLLR